MAGEESVITKAVYHSLFSELSWGLMRLPSRNALSRFFKYAFVGSISTTFDLLVLLLLTEVFGVPFYISTALAFLLATTPNYFFARWFVFRGTKRRMHHGY